MRIGQLTHLILHLIESLPKVDMDPYYALIVQEIEKKDGLGAGKSLVFPRIKALYQRGYIDGYLGASSNPKAKKPVQFYRITKEGKTLLNQLRKENQRLQSLFA
jgi:DNA-binding PadR family transcriptional regulator